MVEFAYRRTNIDRQATCQGAYGRAWSVAMQPLGERGRPDWDATLALWVISAPGSHPLWWWYTMTVVHLRAIAGVKPAHIEVPGSTHELVLVALNPEEPVPNIEALERGDFRSLHSLTPPNLVEQFQVSNDTEGLRLGELAVEAIVHGIISPDTDYRSVWRRLIPETARHLRDGIHKVHVQ